MHPSPLVSTDWLANHLNDAQLVPVDASWHMPDTGREGALEYKTNLIPGAVFFDIDRVVNTRSNMPHTMPSATEFAKAVQTLGISNDDTLIVYDKGDIPTAARVWWMFRAMGHDNIFMLDGGFKKWCAEKHPTTTTLPNRQPSHYQATFKPDLFRDKNAIITNLDNGHEQIIDARAPGRFNGTVPEPRAGLRSGHIPDAVNLPFISLYEANGTLKPASAIKDVIESAGIDLNSPITTSCGSGVTACNLAIAFAALGKWDVAIYDGSWTEWGSNPEVPVEM